MSVRPRLTDAERAKKRRVRKGAGLVHIAFDPVEDVVKAVLIASGIVNENEAADRRNLPLACETLMVKLGNHLEAVGQLLRHGVTRPASIEAEPGVKATLRTKEILNV